MSLADVAAAIDALHLLRPYWLWALLPLPVLLWWRRRRRRREGVWQTQVDPHLLPHLLESRVDTRTRVGVGAATLVYVLTVLALAGPSWRQIEQPLWRSRTPLVIALDLSSATLAADLPPSRLAQARAKIATLLRERQGGQIGLVAYAGDAYTVAPLTDDAGNLALFLDALAPDVMPNDGQRSDRAIAWSMRLLRQARFERGQILLLTDHGDARARNAAQDAARAGYQVSVLGLGETAGAPYRSRDGSIATARLDAASLRALASSGGGRYVSLTPGDDDLRELGVLDPGNDAAGQAGGERGRQWQDEGYWLLPPLMLLALFAFRRRGGALALLLCVLLPWQPARAVDWWQRHDQAEHAQLEQGAKAYRQGDYADAARRYAGVDSADAHYNRGNALAKAGQYPQAISAYDEALRRQPGMMDAIANKRAVEAAMKRQQSGKSDQQKPGQQSPQSGAGGQPQPSQGQGAQAKSAQAQQPDRQSDQQRDLARQSPQTGSQQAPKPADAQAQQAADAAQRERMRRALQQGKTQPGQQRNPAQPAEETPQQRERRLANEAWLRRVPDDPGALLREKFRIENERRLLQGDSQE